MSIWSSITDDGPNAHFVGYPDPTEPPLAYCDVAVATSWNNCIRVAVDNGDMDGAVMLTVDQARQLIADLDAAIVRVEAVT